MATSPFQIDKNIPVPARSGGSGREAIYPFKQMEVGDSFEVKLDQSRSTSLAKLQTVLSACGRGAIGKGGVTTRANKEANSVRVWRVK